MKIYRLRVSPKQIEALRELREDWGGATPHLPPHTISAPNLCENIGGWFGRPMRGEPGRMYIVIEPDGRCHS